VLVKVDKGHGCEGRAGRCQGFRLLLHALNPWQATSAIFSPPFLSTSPLLNYF